MNDEAVHIDKIAQPYIGLPITSTKHFQLKQIKKYKINLNRLEVLRVMGSGSIRVVKLGRLRDDEGQMTNVVVKMLRGTL